MTLRNETTGSPTPPFFRTRSHHYYDVIIVGAGPAGIFAALQLTETMNVLLIDAGRRLEDKSCSLHAAGRCARCAPACHIMSGFGGAQFFLGTKLSRYPAGKALLQFAENDSALEGLYDRVDTILERFGKPPRPQPAAGTIASLQERCDDAGIHFKYYNAQKVSRADMRHIGFRLERDLVSRGVTMRFGERVRGVSHCRGGFEVSTNNGVYGGRRVLLALGRIGGRSLDAVAASLGIRRLRRWNQQVELGVRVETPYAVFKDVDGVHNDLKIGYDLEGSNCMRSFCQDYRGYLTACRYNLDCDLSPVSVDGYIDGTDDGNGPVSNASNLGIHHRFSAQQSLDTVYRMVSAISHSGRPLVQSLRGFMEGRIDDHFHVTPTLRDVSSADLNTYLPQSTAGHIKSFIQRCDRILPGLADGGNAVYAPSFELGAPPYDVDRHFQSTVRGVFVIGDSCGHFRGAVQAMVSGLIASQEILRSTNVPGA